jgi:hypothetical protein
LAGELNVEQSRYLEIVLRNVQQLESMINDLLEVTRVQAGKLAIELQSASLSDPIAYAVNTLRGAATGKGITLSSHIERQLPMVCADPMRIRQILIILVDNAIKFTPAGGEVKIQARRFEKDSGYLIVEVSDTGCGISPGMTHRIFEHLYQVTDPGTAGRKGLGLGLHISKELVTRQGGAIWVSSEPQNGSHFFFTLPIFSVASWIGPMLSQENKSGDCIALITIEMGSQDGWLSPDVRREMSIVARTLVQQCLRPDTDVLLPNMNSASVRELFFVVAYTQEHGAEVISERIRRQFQKSDHLQPANVTFSFFHSFLAPISREAHNSMEAFVGYVAAGVQDRINNIYSQRSV